MQRKFLQEKSLNRSLDNAEKSLNVDLSAKSKLIPHSTAAGMLSLNDLYIEERDSCENYRMIFTVSPICTNVLYNAITEPVYKEGSYSALTLIETAVSLSNTDVFPDGTIGSSGNVNQVYAIRDTEFSHEKIGNFKYHCGYDIFNNHLLRSNEFEHVQLTSDKSNKTEFNTLFDFAVDYSGKTVERVIGESDGPVSASLPKNKIRMYQLDNIRSMNTAFYDELRTVDGWYGFYNTGYINIPNATAEEDGKTPISVNRILNNETPCGFIDLYPDRTLYSFIPKINRFKKRLERNWDCSIVYPYKSDYDMFNRVMLNYFNDDWETWKSENEEKIPNAVRIFKPKVKYNNVGDEIIEMHSLLRHSLQPGDEVILYYTDSDYSEGVYKEIFRYSRPIKVISIGDANGNNENICFDIKFSDINSFCGIMDHDSGEYDEKMAGKKVFLLNDEGEPDEAKLASFFYRKIEGGFEDKYYFRKFKQFKNYEYVQVDEEDIPSEEKVVSVIKEPTIINENSPAYIKLGNDFFEKQSRPLAYTQNKIAYAENIYGDRVAQVIFNDDICITGVKDNLGRPLSTVYFCAVKTNRGYEEWYNSGITSADTVEFSHCFGDITSGLDLPTDGDIINYNVRKLHNVFSSECDPDYADGLEIAMQNAPKGDYKDGTPMPLETGITLEDFDEFYGDIVEYSKTQFMETTLERVYHRFNTAQRECLLNDKYYDVHYDELVGDLYDVEEVNE